MSKFIWGLKRNVTLEFFAELSVKLLELQKLNLYKEKNFPWTVSLGDLEIIKDFLNGSSEFIHYVTFRNNLNKYDLSQYSMVHELDLLAYYCNDFAFNEDMVDEDVDVPNLIKALMNEKPSKKTETSLVVDASYIFNEYYNLKTKGIEVQKISRTYDPKYEKLLRCLESYGNKSGYSNFLLYFMELTSNEQSRFISEVEKRINQYKKDNKDHNFSIPNYFTPKFSNVNCGVTVFVSPIRYGKTVLANGTALCVKNKEKYNTSDWIGVFYFLDSSNEEKNYFVFTGNSLNGIDNKQIVINQKISRNDLCPCNSGKKYKKCHGLK